MALVNTDLFLVQDGTTKSNYKVSFENFFNQIDNEVNLDGRVAVVGDNMTGNLTLGTTKIILNVDGGAKFGEDRITFLPSGVVETWRKTNSAPDKLHSWHSNVSGSRAEKIRFNADGSGTFEGAISAFSYTGGDATFTGDIVANDATFADVSGDLFTGSFSGDGSLLTNLPVIPGLWELTGDNLSPLSVDTNLTNITDITISGDFVATGTIEGESIDGGSY